MSTEVKVACPCPGTPHPDGDTVVLKAEPDVALFTAFNITFGSIEGSALSIDQFNADMQGAFSELYLRHGIDHWTFVDGRGDDIPVRPSTVKALLPFYKGGKEVIDACDALYSKELLAPFVEAAEKAQKAKARELQARTKKSSPAGRTERSTSRTRASGSALRVVSPPSSPTDTDGRPSEVRAS